MLFDYLAEKHNVSWPELLTSHFFTAFPMALLWTHGCFMGKWEGRAEQGKVELLPKILNSFSGFVWLAQILWTFTFCGELLRINGITQDSWIEPQECRRFYIYQDVWLLTLPFIGPLLLQDPAVLSVPPQSPSIGPLSMLEDRLYFGFLKICVNGMTSLHAVLIYWTSGNWIQENK